MQPQHLPYRSIACGAYDLFEAAAMRRHRVRLTRVDGTEIDGQVLDVYARGAEEFCRFGPDGSAETVEYRLDTITEIIDLHDGTRLLTGSC